MLWLSLFLLGRRGGEPRFLGIPRGAWVLLGTCAVCGGAFLLWALAGMGFDVAAFLERVGLILNDPQYGFNRPPKSWPSWPGSRCRCCGAGCGPLAAALVLGAWLFRLRKAFARERVALLLGLWALFAIAQCTVRAVRDGSLTNGSLCRCWCWPGRGPSGALAGWTACRRSSGWGYLPGLAAYLFILRSTVLGLPATFLYLTWPAFCGLLVVLRRQPRMGRALLAGMLIFLAVCRVGVRPDHRLEIRHGGRHAAGGH